MNDLMLSFLIGLAIFGVVELIACLCRFAFSRQKQDESVIVMPLKGELPDLEFSVRRIRHEQNWRYRSDCRVFLVDLGMSQESRRIAEILVQDIDGVYLCKQEELLGKIRENICLQSR